MTMTKLGEKPEEPQTGSAVRNLAKEEQEARIRLFNAAADLCMTAERVLIEISEDVEKERPSGSTYEDGGYRVEDV